MIMPRVGLVLLNLVLVAWTFPSIAETYYVRPDGDDQAEGKSPQTAFKTLLRAAHVLNHGDAVLLAPGTYHDEVLLAERFSADGAEMQITGDESGQRTAAPPGPVVIRAENSTGTALEIQRFRNLRISGLTFRGPGQGLKVQRSSGVVVQRCSFEGLSRGLALGQCQDVRVESSVFSRCTLGVFCQSAVRTRLAHLTVSGASSAGILVLSSGEGAIRNSLLTGNNTNLIADEISGPAWTSDHNVLEGSTGPWGGVPVIAKVYEWASASGQDRHSVYVMPAFQDPDSYDLHPAATVTWAGGLPGARVGQVLDPKVELDRDGRPLTVREGAVCAGAYDYPAEPQPGAGWRRLEVNLRGQGPRQSAALYATDGTLVRTLVADAAGVHELWWDGLDDLGQPVPPARYQVRAITHDARLVDDGAVGDNGNPLGAFNCDNADRVVSLADGGFIVTTIYDEAGYSLRRYSSSGQPIFASNLAQKDFAAIALGGDDIYGVVGTEAKTRLVRIVLPGDRARMANGADDYRLFADHEKPGEIAGVAVAGGQAYIAASGMNVVRVIDLATGTHIADWTLPAVADLTADGQGALWAISGKDVVALDRSGHVTRRYGTGLEKPRYLAARADRLAVVDRTAERLALLDVANGRVLRTLGKPRPPGAWMPVGPETFSDPRGCAFLGDGRLVLTEHDRVRILWPEAGRISADIVSDFMDVAVVHQPGRNTCTAGWASFTSIPSRARGPGSWKGRKA